MTVSLSGRWGKAASIAVALLAIAAVAASVAVYRQVFVANPQLWTHSDEWIYRAAGTVARAHPADLYHVRMGAPGEAQLPFTYPPFAALVFAAGSGLNYGLWQLALVIIDLALLPVITYASLRIAGHRGPQAAVLALALAAVELWLEPVYGTMFFGQLNLILLTLIVLDFALPDSCRLKGVCTGIAAGLKLTPLIFIPYLLVTRRIRAAIISTLTFAATIALAFAVLPAASAQYWGGTFAAGPGGEQNLVDQSVDGVVHRLLHQQHPATMVWAAVAIGVAVAGVTVAALAWRRGLELLGLVLCGITGLLVSPISWTHHWVWVVPALALLVAGEKRTFAGDPSLAAGRPGWRGLVARGAGSALLLALFLDWPARVPLAGGSAMLPWGLLRRVPHGFNLEYTWHGATLLLGNAYVIAGLAAIVGAAGYLRATRGRPGARDQVRVEREPTALAQARARQAASLSGPAGRPASYR